MARKAVVASVKRSTPTPPANAFVEEAAKDIEQPCFPLDVYFCGTCAQVQLLDVVDPVLLYENYVYVSGTSPTFVKHFDGYANDIIRRFKPPAGSLIVDIGSNDGVLLRPENYYRIPNSEDRLFVSPEHVPLFVERGWKREASA